MGEEVPPQNHQYLHYHSLEVADASSSLFSSFANDDSTAATGIDGTASSITVDSRRNQNSCTGCSSGTEWVLIQGAAGVGKTAMAHFPRTIPKRSNANGSIFNSDTDESSNTPATTTTTTATVDSGATTEADCGFVTAKFHPLQRADPQTAFVEAIADWVHRQLAATSNNKNSNEDWREVFLVPQKQNGSTSNIGQENDNNIGLQSLLDMVPALKNVLLLEAKRDPDSNTSTKDSETTSLAQDSTSEDESTSDATEKRLRQLTKSYQSERLRWPTAQVNGGGGGGGSTSSGGLVCRWKEAVVWFVQSLASWNHRRHQAPLVFLFDDLHCADECSIGIVLALTESKAISNVLFMGTAQANDLGQTPEHLTRLFKSFRESNVQFTRLSLSCLQESDVDCLLADLVHVDSERTMDFVSFVASQTRGNVCDIWWYLDMLQSKQLLRLDDTGKIIAWDMDDIRLEALNLDEHFKSMITKLSTFDLELLTIASFLGPTLDERIVMSLVECDVDTFALFTQNVSSLGLLSYDSSRESWFFTQSIIQEKTCQLIPESEREYYHYRIGRKLWRRFDLNELDHYIFLVVDQLSYSFNCITNPKESLAIAKLCLCAGVRAVHLSSFQASIGYLENGIALLSPNGFELAYETWLDLHNAAAEVANSLGNYKRVHELVDEVLLHAQTNGDKLRAQAVMIHAFGSDGRFSDALTLALGVLKTLGESIPMKPSKPMILLEFLVLRRRLSRMTNAAILRLPTMVDIHKLAAMQMMNLLFFSALMKKNEIVPYIGFRMVRLTLDYGLSAVSCIGFILFASTLSG